MAYVKDSFIEDLRGGFSKKELEELKKQGITVECKKCGEIKPLSKFTFKRTLPSKRYYFQSTCNKCNYERKMKAHAPKLEDYRTTQIYKELHTIEGRACMLRNRCKQRSKIYNHEFDLSKIELIKRLKPLKCEVTGIPLVLGELNFNPYAPSIDRIDSDKGYTSDNIKIVCMIYNFCKNHFSDDEVKQFIKDAYNGIYKS